MQTPTPTAKKELAPEAKAMLLQACEQIKMLATAFPEVPERVSKAAKEFTDALTEWAQ